MKKVILFVILSALIFATMEVALKIAGNSLDPFQMTFLRFLIGGIILIPPGIWELRKNGVRIDFGLLRRMLLLGFICVPLSMMLFQYGVLKSNASTSAVIFCVNPVFTALFAHFLNRNDRLTISKILSFAAAVPGIILLIRPWDMQAGNTAMGVIMTLGAAALFALYSVIGTRTVGKIGAFAQTSMSFLFGSAILLLVLIIQKRPIVSNVYENLPAVLYVGIAVTGAGYLFYFLAIRYSNATTGSVAFLLKPAIAPVIAVLVLHEKIVWTTVAGIAFILTASYLNMRSNRQGVKAEA